MNLRRWIGLLLLSLGCAPPQERLRTAVTRDRPDDAEAALKAGADPNQGSLAEAVTFARVEVARVLLAHKADPNQLTRDGSSLLHGALDASPAEKRRALVRLLLEAGADPNRIPKNELPPLVDALTTDSDPQLVQLLLDHKADPNARVPPDLSWGGSTPLDVAIDSKEPRLKEFEALLAAGARIQDSGVVPIALAKGKLDLFRLMLEKGASIDSLCPGAPAPRGLRTRFTGAFGDPCSGMTAFAFAAGKGDLETMRMLLDRGARLDAPDAGLRPLHAASRLNQLPALRLLLGLKADPKALDPLGATPLHGAGSEEAIRLLLAAGIPADSRDKDGNTPLMWAVADDLREPPVAEADAPKKPEASREQREGRQDEPAARPAPRPLALALLAAGAAPDRPDSQGLRPLHHVLRHADYLTAEKLLALKATPGARDAKEIAPLAYMFEHHAFNHATWDPDMPLVVTHLLERGASADVRASSKGALPLAIALENGNHALVQALLDGGADPASVEALVKATTLPLDRSGNPVPPGSPYASSQVAHPLVAAAESPPERVIAAARARHDLLWEASRESSRQFASKAELQKQLEALRAAADQARAAAGKAREKRSEALEQCLRKGILDPHEIEECIQRRR